MKLLKKSKNIILMLLALISTVLCIVMPKNLIKRETDKFVGVALDVPEEYYPTSSYYEVLKESSERLTDYQKRQLISGKWESEISKVDEEYYENTEDGMISTAKEVISNLNHIGAYPIEVDSTFEQTYAARCTYMQALDSNFRSYAGFFWKVEFTNSEKKENITIYMTQDGLPVKLLYNAGKADKTTKWKDDEFKKLAYLMFGSFVYKNGAKATPYQNSIIILESGEIGYEAGMISGVYVNEYVVGDDQVVYYKGKVNEIDSTEVIQVKIGMNGVIGINDIKSISEDEERAFIDYLEHDRLNEKGNVENSEIKSEYLDVRKITVVRSERTSSEKTENKYYIYTYNEDGKYMVGLVPVK